MRGTLRVTLFVLLAAVGVVLVGSSVWQWIPRNLASTDAAQMSLGEERVTIDVRNAGGVAGMARTATDHLRAAGFDVVSLGNAGDFGHDTTVVIDRVGATEKAAAVARALGVARVASEPDPNLFVDVTVRLGSDWKAPARVEPAPRGPRGLIAWVRGLTMDR